MNRLQSLSTSGGTTDERDFLIAADEGLARLQEACGGTVPGMLAIPELLDLVQQSRQMGLRIAREFSAFDGQEKISALARIRPLFEEDGSGCEIRLEQWQTNEAPALDSSLHLRHLDEADRATAEVVARLDRQQCVQLISSDAGDAAELLQKIADEPGRLWSDYVELYGVAHQQPLHWRLLDGVQCRFDGSQRDWRVRIFPVGSGDTPARGFELLLISDQPLVEPSAKSDNSVEAHSRMIGTTLTPVLRQPIARIIANAETVRSRLAGPIKQEYSDYAGHIVSAGQHLSTMLDDLADLEVVEAPGFSTAKEPVDLSDAAIRAAGILGVKAQKRSIELVVDEQASPVMALGEFRRVLQVLINLIGNAIAYSPEGTSVEITAHQGPGSGEVSLTVTDQGPGISEEQAARIFDKFERLGRDSNGGADTGSGLGLYISYRLAQAMDGQLELVQGTEDQAEHAAEGAQFRLRLPADEGFTTR